MLFCFRNLHGSGQCTRISRILVESIVSRSVGRCIYPIRFRALRCLNKGLLEDTSEERGGQAINMFTQST